MRTPVSAIASGVIALTVVPPAAAQGRHAASQSAIEAALQEHAARADADRERVRRVLAHPEVADVARKAGIDLRRAADAVATLAGDDLARVAGHARQVEQALAGGQSAFVISTTTIIIVLLLVILIIVAVD